MSTVTINDFDMKVSLIKDIPEFIRIENEKIITDIGLINGDLVFHFFGNKKAWKNWSNEKIDNLFSEVFQAPVKDMTGLFEKRIKELAGHVSGGVFLRAFNEIRNDPAKIQKSYEEKLPMYEKGKDWSKSNHQQTWSYIVKKFSNPYVDVLAKRIVDGIVAILA